MRFHIINQPADTCLAGFFCAKRTWRLIMPTFYGKDLAEAVRKATGREESYNASHLERKGRFQIWAPPRLWGPWVPIYTLFGHAGPDSDNRKINLRVSYSTQSDSSGFEVEIRGGDRLVRGVGPGHSSVLISGNVMTEISIRCRSYSLGQHVIVNV